MFWKSLQGGEEKKEAMSDQIQSTKDKLPKEIWILGFVSLFTDVSSEIVHGLLPVFLVSVLAASYTTVGIVEGLGEGTALLFKIISGPLSDRLKNRKSLVLLGYALGALSKPLFAIAPSSFVVMGARIFDRMGKGIRGAPRDALIADITPDSLRGGAFGLRQSLDTVGAFVGPLLAILLMYTLNGNFRLIFWLAAVPGLLSVGLIVFGLQEPETNSANKKSLSLKDLRNFNKAFWFVCTLGAILQMARFSEAFLILRAKDYGLSFGWAPVVLVVMNIVYALTAYPAGEWSDRGGRKKIILIGFLVLVLADLALGLGNNLFWVFGGVALWGLHLGLTQGILAALVADTCPREYRGTAYGFFNLFSAVALILGGPLAGFLWDKFGAVATFLFSAGIAVFCLILLQIKISDAIGTNPNSGTLHR